MAIVYNSVTVLLLQGEGVAYRGRALVELQTVMGEMPERAVEDIIQDDMLRVQVQKSTILTASSCGVTWPKAFAVLLSVSIRSVGQNLTAHCICAYA